MFSKLVCFDFVVISERKVILRFFTLLLNCLKTEVEMEEMFQLFESSSSSSSESEDEYFFMFNFVNKKRKIRKRVKGFLTEVVDQYSDEEVIFRKHLTYFN